MDEYLIRKVTPDDFPYLANMIIGAAKGNSEKLSFATLFNLEDNGVKDLIISILKRNVDGSEFSPSSYLVADFNGVPVASVAAWIECNNGNLPSRILKSNLLSFLLEKKHIQYLLSNSNIIADFVIEREKMSLQFEYMFVAKEHRGRGLSIRLINEHLANAFSINQGLMKAQLQVYGNNIPAIKLYEKNGFRIVRSSKSYNSEILNYLPHNVKLLMEKDLRLTSFGKK